MRGHEKHKKAQKGSRRASSVDRAFVNLFVHFRALRGNDLEPPSIQPDSRRFRPHKQTEHPKPYEIRFGKRRVLRR
jgi:hypothetical protein